VTTLDGSPDRLDGMVQQLEERDIPTFHEMDGFRGMTVFADRSSGKALAITYWDTEDQMKDSEEKVLDARRRAAEAAGHSGEPQVERLEVLLDTFVR
jgi:heme-degrading monooxygenase HmoA